MKSRCLLVVLVVALSASIAAGGFPSRKFQITFPNPGGKTLYLAVVDKKLAASAAAEVWYIDGTRIKAASGDGYLAYDLSGKDNKVFLVPKPGDNTEWKVTTNEIRGPSGKPEDVEGYRSSFSAARGKLAGKALCLQTIKAKEGEKVPTHQPVLGGEDTWPEATAFREVDHK
jgi:hypothetical protein